MDCDNGGRMSTLEERLEKLESRLDRKNWWEKLDVLGTLAVAVAIGLAGHWFSSRTAAAQITSAERLADRDREISAGNFRVEQARLISTFLEALVSDDAPRRKLA